MKNESSKVDPGLAWRWEELWVVSKSILSGAQHLPCVAETEFLSLSHICSCRAFRDHSEEKTFFTCTSHSAMQGDAQEHFDLELFQMLIASWLASFDSQSQARPLAACDDPKRRSREFCHQTKPVWVPQTNVRMPSTQEDTFKHPYPYRFEDTEGKGRDTSGLRSLSAQGCALIFGRIRRR